MSLYSVQKNSHWSSLFKQQDKGSRGYILRLHSLYIVDPISVSLCSENIISKTVKHKKFINIVEKEASGDTIILAKENEQLCLAFGWVS